MFRFLALFFGCLALLIFGAVKLIGTREPSAEAMRAGQPYEETESNLYESTMNKYNKLTPEESRVIIGKGTEAPDGFMHKGEYTKTAAEGLYVCRQCNAPLYTSEHKFQSSCGWPAFDDEIAGAVRREGDADGRRVEILCENCGGHLGHVFTGERLTSKNTRHCVNSVSMKFYEKGTEPPKKIVLEEEQGRRVISSSKPFLNRAKNAAKALAKFFAPKLSAPSPGACGK